MKRTNTRKGRLAKALVFILLSSTFEPNARYQRGANLTAIGENVGRVAESFYPLAWETRAFTRDTDESAKKDRGLLRGAESEMSLESSLHGGNVDVLVSIQAQEYGKGKTPWRGARLHLNEWDVPSARLADSRSVDCWCIDRGSYAYPSCSSKLIFEPYRVAVYAYYFLGRCSGRDVQNVPPQTKAKFSRLALATEIKVAEMLAPLRLP